MAKLYARGHHGVAAFTAEKWVTTESGSTLYRMRYALRSDGMILRRIIWSHLGGTRLKHTSGYSQWRKLKPEVPCTGETLSELRQRMDFVIIDEAAERRERAQAHAAKRREDRGPDQPDHVWAMLYARAHEAGMAAGQAAEPKPMIVEEHADPTDPSSPIVRSDVVTDGPCGFAYVKVLPADSSCGTWATRARGWRGAHGGGLERGVVEFNQSMTRKGAYASAFARVLREAGLNAYGFTRPD